MIFNLLMNMCVGQRYKLRKSTYILHLSDNVWKLQCSRQMCVNANAATELTSGRVCDCRAGVELWWEDIVKSSTLKTVSMLWCIINLKYPNGCCQKNKTKKPTLVGSTPFHFRCRWYSTWLWGWAELPHDAEADGAVGTVVSCELTAMSQLLQAGPLMDTRNPWQHTHMLSLKRWSTTVPSWLGPQWPCSHLLGPDSVSRFSGSGK